MITIMSHELIERLRLHKAKPITIDAAAYVFHRHDPVNHVYAVLNGHVALIRPQRDGKTITLQQASPGMFLAEASLNSEHYHCDAIAHSPSQLIAIAKPVFLNLLANDADFALAWAAYLAAQVQNARFRSEILVLKTVAERLDAWLDWHKHTPPAKGKWKDLAHEIGVSPEALYRELARRRNNT